MSVTTSNPRNSLKKPLVSAMFGSGPLTALTGTDSANRESIYEGWHAPEQVTVTFPYITYRINWYPRTPTGFLGGTMLVDVWDTSPQGNDARKTESICTLLSLLFDGTEHVDGIIIIRTRLTADEWIQDEEPGRIHRQLVFDLRTIDLYHV